MGIDIILYAFNDIYYETKSGVSNFYDVINIFDKIIGFTGTPIIYPISKLYSKEN